MLIMEVISILVSRHNMLMIYLKNWKIGSKP